jgi:PBP1b-binding outer membrane lipoprotein LpoB
MKKTILTAIFLAYLLTSCGSRKVNKEQLETKIETKTEVVESTKSLDSTKVETNENYSSKISSESFIKDFTFEPIDNTKPYFIGSQKYENVKVVNKESNIKFTQEIDFLRNQIDQRFIESEIETTTLTIEVKELKQRLKESERKAGVTGLIIWISILLLLLIIGYIIYRMYFKNFKL